MCKYIFTLGAWYISEDGGLSWKRTKEKRDPFGDFDDMGRKSSESAYHYANKRKLGRF